MFEHGFRYLFRLNASFNVEREIIFFLLENRKAQTAVCYNSTYLSMVLVGTWRIIVCHNNVLVVVVIFLMAPN